MAFEKSSRRECFVLKEPASSKQLATVTSSGSLVVVVVCFVCSIVISHWLWSPFQRTRENLLVGVQGQVNNGQILLLRLLLLLLSGWLFSSSLVQVLQGASSCAPSAHPARMSTKEQTLLGGVCCGVCANRCLQYKYFRPATKQQAEKTVNWKQLIGVGERAGSKGASGERIPWEPEWPLSNQSFLLIMAALGADLVVNTDTKPTRLSPEF